jgi:hypothetical protein
MAEDLRKKRCEEDLKKEGQKEREAQEGEDACFGTAAFHPFSESTSHAPGRPCILYDIHK